MNNLKYIIICGAVIALSSCSDFLDVTPKGTLSDGQLNTPETVEKLIIAAYSSVETDRDYVPWHFSDLRSGDAYKGGGGTGDMAWAHRSETALTLRVNEGAVNNKWIGGYRAISRIHNALARINNLDASEYPVKTTRIGELLFLRAHQMFELKRTFKHIVWVDETVMPEDYINISNVEYTDQELWDKIIEDLRTAVEYLPNDNVDVGRANKFSAKAYLARVLMYAAYEQNEKHEIVNINQSKLEEAIRLVDDLAGQYSLADDFAKNFLVRYENGVESIFAIQSSQEDATPYGRLNIYSHLSYPVSAEYGCCGLHVPSQNLVNAFKTDPTTGLPLFDTFDTFNKDILNGDDVKSLAIDPRLLHTVAIIGVPYKYKATYLMDEGFPRDIPTYGPFLSMKEVEIYDCGCGFRSSWFYTSSLNRDILRYDDLLLLKAEALIELGRHTEALPIINQIRTRAANSTALLIDANGSPTGNFKISLYQDGENCVWNQDYARKALRFERRLELAMESSSGFDLVRWGIAAETMSAYYQTEQVRRDYLRSAQYTKNRDEYFPIPYQQISFSKGLYKQNYGWPEQ